MLKKLRDDWNPHIGFNLHNQQSLTTVGKSNKQATISLLVVYGDAEKTSTEGLERNRRVTSAIVSALQKFIPENIANTMMVTPRPRLATIFRLGARP